MSSLTLETPVGYVAAQDLYVSFSEYYGDGTIYGYTELLTPDGNPVKGAGKSKTDLVNENVVLGNNLGSVSGDLVVVAAAEVAAEVAEVPAEVPAEVAVEVTEVPDANLYTVSFSFMGFDITRDFTAKIDTEGRKIYLS
jgi:hypothetical protein